MKRILIILTSALLLVAQLYAGDASRIGTAAGTQVLVPVGARNLAMGGANIAYTHGLEAIYWNPAGFARMENRAAGAFSTMSLFNDTNVNYAAFGVRFGRNGNLGFSLKSFDFGDIPVTTEEDNDGLAGQTFSPTFVTLGISYARQLTDAIAFGFTSKLVYESIPRASANAFAIDAGIQYQRLAGVEGLSFGLTVKNIGTNMTYSGSGLLVNGTSVGNSQAGSGLAEYVNRPAASDQLPASIELGMGYQHMISEENQLTLTGIFDNQNFGNDVFRFGAEYLYSSLFALRGGYSMLQNTDADDRLYGYTFGLGLNYAFGNTALQFDYAYREAQYFDGSNLFSVTIAF